MRKRQGFISIIALIIMSVLLFMVLYLGYTSQLEYLILSSSTSEAKGYYQSEGKIFLSLYDEKYYNGQLYLNIIDYFRNDRVLNKPKVVVIDDLDLDPGDSRKNVELKYFEKKDRIRMDIIAKSSSNGIVTELTSSGTLVNEIFESGYSILSYETVDEKHREELANVLLQINEGINVDNCHKPESLYGVDLDLYSEIMLTKRDKNNYDLSCKRDTMTNPYVEGYPGGKGIVIARKPEGGDLDFLIGDPDKTSGELSLTGILYVNGNLVITDEFVFNGILIVENGQIIINTSERPKISGLVILNNVENYGDFIEKTDIILVKRTVYRYGTYVPGFLDPKVSVMKSNRIREWKKWNFTI